MINQHVSISRDKPNVAMVIEVPDTEGGFSPKDALCDLLRRGNVNIIVNFFNEGEFKAKGYFSKIYNGDTKLLKEAGALSIVDYIMLGKLKYSCKKGSPLDPDLTTCNITFSYRIIGKDYSVIKSNSIKVVGPGFSEDASLQRGLEIISENYADEILKPVL